MEIFRSLKSGIDPTNPLFANLFGGSQKPKAFTPMLHWKRGFKDCPHNLIIGKWNSGNRLRRECESGWKFGTKFDETRSGGELHLEFSYRQSLIQISHYRMVTSRLLGRSVDWQIGIPMGMFRGIILKPYHSFDRWRAIISGSIKDKQSMLQISQATSGDSGIDNGSMTLLNKASRPCIRASFPNDDWRYCSSNSPKKA